MSDPGRRIVVAPDAAARIAAAAAWLAGLPPAAEALVCAPTWESCDDLVRANLGPAGARFGLVRLTLERLALRLAAPALAAAGRTPATGLAQIASVARAVHRLAADAPLAHFAPVADRPGFPVAVCRTLEEVRMAGLAPAALAEAPRVGADLVRLAAALEDAQAEAALADRAGCFTAAIAVARGPAPPRPLGLPLLLLDVSPDSVLEEALVAALADRAPAVLATVPRGDEAGLERLARALGVEAERAATPPSPGSLGALQTHLFESTQPQRTQLDASVSLAAWPGESRECVEIARAIQGEAAAGTPFDRMAVLLHAPGDYVSHLEEAFGRAGIPATFARGTIRPHPAGRALLTLLACAAEGLSARRFAEYLSLSQVPDPGATAERWVAPENDLLPAAPAEARPDDDPLLRDPDAAPVVAGTLRAPRHWEQLVVEAAVIGGRTRWETRLEGLAHDLEARRRALDDGEEARAAYLERQLRDLRHLRDFALPLVKQLAALPARASWGEWLEALAALAGAALREPEAVLAALGELAPMAPVGPVDLDEVRLVLGARLRDVAVPPPRRRYGTVLVTTAERARGLVFDVVFVPGLAEQLFPAKIVEDPILLDEARRVLRAGLPTQRERVARERLALRLAVGAARRRVVLSYPRIDVQRARPRVPSFYALETLRAAEGWLPGFDDLARRAERAAAARLGWPAPERPQDAVDEAEYDLALLAPLLDADAATTAGTATYLLGANPHLARALRARARRWLRRWTPADGMVDPDALGAAALEAHQLERRSYSPTALQHFAACPYRFFLQAVHRLAPRDEPVAIETMDPLVRGSLFHDVQFELLTRLRDRGRLPLRRDALEGAWALLDEVLACEAAKVRDALAPAIPRVWQDGVEGVRADLRQWLERQADARDGWVPARFELSFGLPAGDRERADPASRPAPVPLLGGLLELRGSIDLVERHERGALRATDHKTGKAWAKPGVRVGGGEVLQPLLYALACERLLGGEVVEGRLYYCTAAGDWSERVVPLDDSGRERISEVVRIVGDAVRQRFLPAAPAEASTCERCDYRPVCGPYEWIRTQRKPHDRLALLARLRAMP